MVAVGYGWDVPCPNDPEWDVSHIEPSNQEEAQQQDDPYDQRQLCVHCQRTEKETKGLKEEEDESEWAHETGLLIPHEQYSTVRCTAQESNSHLTA